jgi:hypothetical protein
MERQGWTPLATAAGIGAGLVFAGAAVARAVSTVAGLREDEATTGEASALDAAPAADHPVGATAAAAANPASEGGEHVPTDLMGDTHPDGSERAVDAFRPDPTAPIPAGERDAFRPALGAPTLVKGEADDIPRRSAEASSDGMGTIGGIGAVGGAGAETPRVNTPEAPKVG